MESENQDKQTSDQDSMDTLRSKIEELEKDNNQMRDEFNLQRAKMKELFLQKEEELKRRSDENSRLQEEMTKLRMEFDECKSQLVVASLTLENDVDVEKRKAQEEIQSLQQVVLETLKESSLSKDQLENELQKCRSIIQKLEQENSLLKSQMSRDTHPDGPQISLSTVTKTIARKVASQLGADALSLGSDNLEESMRKAEEDAEVLRSLVVPLEEEIKALKEKLRSTDDELQRCKEAQQVAQKRPQQETGSLGPSCDMCMNYEAQLVKIQTTAKELETRLSESERMLQAQREELAKEVEFRKGMEEKWNEKKEEHRAKVVELTTASQAAQQALHELKQTYRQGHQGIVDELSSLARSREQVQRHLLELQRENEMLVGKHSKHSQQLQSESINMPNNVEELHLSLLKSHEDLITARVAQEVAQEKEETSRYEISLLREQMDQDNRAREQQDAIFTSEIQQLKVQVEKYRRDIRELSEKEERLQRVEKELEYVTKEKNEANTTIAELRQRVASLQQVLDTSGEVQKDFVRLSQSLQVQLEKIRESGSEVRWQHEEDVDECPSCHTAFTMSKKKIHCRHCGHVFCQACMTRTVNSGPKQRPSRVCGVCHTLLVRDTAPYFSQEPPHTPD